MKKNLCIVSTCFLILTIFLIDSAVAQGSYSPQPGNDHPMNVYWGDTHLHTNLSTDSYWIGNTFISPEQAYRFAKGEPIETPDGQQVQMRRPLDFLVVADHAENLGVAQALDMGNPLLLETEAGRDWYQRIQSERTDSTEFSEQLRKLHFEHSKEIASSLFRLSIWETVIAQAEIHNDPDNFTAFIGYEWSSRRPYYNHRVVIFRDGAEKASQDLPYSSHQGGDPEQLWAYLSDYQRRTGGDVLAIPHTANLSDGKMFMEVDYQGRPFSRSYAQTRSRWEPLFEVTQTKGTSEAHPQLSPTDTFADFEIWDRSKESDPAKYLEKKRYEYARSALQSGLRQYSKLGVNPFKFGMIGGTDAHLGLSEMNESNFFGHVMPSAKRIEGWQTSASGYAAIWAEENTRESLFAAMKRKEVYATTGPRMTVRFFGGWDYVTDDAFRPDLARVGYKKGVPMGGDLSGAPKGKSPSFLIRAVKDPDGANLDRVQVIKGWRDNKGELHEKIYNVALSDHRKENRKGNVKPVGDTVDIKNASYTNTIGDPELAIVWTDPDFKKDELAFYYVRVLEIPTPRWTAYDAKYFNLTVSDEVPMITRERAYTSPIWYTP